MAYTSEYRFLVSGGFDFDIIVWNPYVTELILRLSGHTSAIRGLAIPAGTPFLLSADASGSIRVWNMQNFMCMQTFSTEERVGNGSGTGETSETGRGEAAQRLSGIALVPMSQTLISVGRMMHLFEVSRLDNPRLTDDTPIITATFNTTSLTIMTVSSGGVVKIWNALTGRLSRVYRTLEGGFSSASEVTAACLDCRQRKFLVANQLGCHRP